MDRNFVMTEPKDLVRIELKNAGFDLDHIKVPKRVFFIALCKVVKKKFQ